MEEITLDMIPDRWRKMALRNKCSNVIVHPCESDTVLKSKPITKSTVLSKNEKFNKALVVAKSLADKYHQMVKNNFFLSQQL